MNSFLDKFLSYLEAEKRYSKLTVRAYGDDIRQFFLFINRNADEFTAIDINEHNLSDYMMSLTGDQKLKPASINRKISSLRALYRYMKREQDLRDDPFRHIRAQKKSAKLPVFVENSRMQTITRAMLEVTDDFDTERDSLIILLFYATGIRVAELMDIRISDFDADITQLKVRGKGGKERMVPIVPIVKRKIINYLREIDEQKICFSKDNYLFLTVKGERVSRTSIYRLVHTILRQFGVKGKSSPHVLRHTFATHMLNSGADIKTIQELLGHKGLVTTQIYTHNSIEDLKRAYDSTHPWAKK